MFESLKNNTKNIFKNKELNEIFVKCFFNTIDTTLSIDNNQYFVITGDIPAMWLRDSSMQIMHYLYFVEDKEVQSLIKGVLKTQFKQICIDSYANAFMRDEKQVSEWDGQIKTDYLPKIVWERKYELDSLCYPLFLAVKYYQKTNDLSIFDDLFLKAFDKIVDTAEKEKKHSSLSTYYFIRGVKEDIGRNTNPKEEKGLIWSGFRPSDDACKYHYHIPDNMFFVSVISQLIPVFKTLKDEKRADFCMKICIKLAKLIGKYGIQNIEGIGEVYVSETNCLGEYHLDDDANIPSLLSLPFLEYPYLDQKTYLRTRKYVLSKNNKYYYEGSILKGIGSPHTPANRVWPLSLSMQGITSNDKDEIIDCLKQLIKSTDGTQLMHESVDVNDTSKYSRPWFSWANSQFCLFVLKHKDLINRYFE